MLKYGFFTSLLDHNSIPILETIIEYLCFLLEYDEHYSNELGGHVPPIKRKWIEN